MILIPEISRSVRFDVLISQHPLTFSSRSMAVSFFKATMRISSRKVQSKMLSALPCIMSKSSSNASYPSSFGSSQWPLSFRHWMMLPTVNCDTSCVPSFIFTMIFGCPCKPLRYSLGPNLSRSSNLNSTCQSLTPVSHSQIFRRYGHKIVAHAHPLCGQFHKTSPRISAPLPV